MGRRLGTEVGQLVKTDAVLRSIGKRSMNSEHVIKDEGLYKSERFILLA